MNAEQKKQDEEAHAAIVRAWYKSFEDSIEASPEDFAGYIYCLGVAGTGVQLNSGKK